MKRAVALYAALAAAALGWTGYWFLLADRAGAAIDDRIAGLGARGVAASFVERRIVGYPYRLSVEFTGPEVAWSAAGADWRWRGDAAAVHAEPWNLRHYIAVFDGGHRLRAAAGGRRLDLDVAAESARASVALDDSRRPERAVAELAGLTLSPRGGGGGIRVGRLQFAARRGPPEGGPATDIALRLADLLLAESPAAGLGARVGLFSVDASLAGAPPAAWTAAALARWRDRGGAVEVRSFAIDWGPIALRGGGRLRLDDSLRPEGALDCRIAGFPALVDLLAAQGVLDGGAALALRLAAGLLSETPEGGGAPEVPLPVVLRDGALALGPVALAPLAPVAAATPAARR